MTIITGLGLLLLTLAAFSLFSMKAPKGSAAMSGMLSNLPYHTECNRFHCCSGHAACYRGKDGTSAFCIYSHS